MFEKIYKFPFCNFLFRVSFDTTCIQSFKWICSTNILRFFSNYNILTLFQHSRVQIDVGTVCAKPVTLFHEKAPFACSFHLTIVM